MAHPAGESNDGVLRLDFDRRLMFTPADATALGVGTITYVAMIFLHPILIGVPVIGG